jgi:c-di-GMP-binding flagellar brake protein YcgR
MMAKAKATTVKAAAARARGALSLCPLLAAAAFADGLPNWTGRPVAVGGIAAFFGTVIALLVFSYISSGRKRAKIEQERSARLFGEGCERCRLTREEMNVLFGMVAFAPDPPTKGHLIFDSLPLYERCLDAYVERTLRMQTSDGRLAEQDEILLRLRKKMGYSLIAPEQPLISTRNLSIGQKVSVFIPGQRTESFGAVVTHLGEFWFTVRLTEDFTGVVNLAGTEKILAFLRQGDAAYSVTAKVREFAQSDEISFFHSARLSRNQNRQYMRLDVNLTLKYRFVERPGMYGERIPSDLFTAHTADISGGGVCLVADEPLAAGDIIMLAIYIPGFTLNGIKSKVLKVIPMDSKGWGKLYRHLVQFVSIEPRQRERIVKYVFETHRATLQKKR